MHDPVHQGWGETAVKSVFFCGIGGSGMSPLAQVLQYRGISVRGSDRSHDRGQQPELYRCLASQGISLFPQDGSGIDRQVGRLVISSAVEPEIADVHTARQLGIPVVHRAAVLAELFNEAAGMAVSGTSGKSTITGMIGHILRCAGKQPTVVNGAILSGYDTPPWLGNALCGASNRLVIEADESDGTIELYQPEIGVVANLSEDHKPLHELRPLFHRFCQRARKAVVLNLDCSEAQAFRNVAPRTVTFSLTKPADFRVAAIAERLDGTVFRVGAVTFELALPGRHNVANAAAAVAACAQWDVTVEEAAAALRSFRGVRRRLERLGTVGGIAVIDDFAHNPEKISASLDALRSRYERLLVMYQPHGFGPTRFLRDRLVDAFRSGLRKQDCLAMVPIYYAGGTATRDLSAADLVADLAECPADVRSYADRESVAAWFVGHARPDDSIIVMGARDSSLSEFARELLTRLEARAHATGIPQ